METAMSKAQRDPSSSGPIEVTRQCVAHRKNGDRCKRSAIKGGQVCPAHGGSAKQVREAAQRRLLEAADGLMANLIRIALSGESEANRLRATMEALSRAGLVERHIVHVGTRSPFDDLLAELVDDGVLVDAPASRALPSGAPSVHHDEDYDPTPEDEGDLSFQTEDTIMGEVVPPVQQITRLPASRPNPPAHLRRGLPPDRGGVEWRG
jgi:hypothetical protein